MNALRSSLLRILLIALMPFLVVTSALAATGSICLPDQHAQEMASTMSDCGERDGESHDQMPRCSFDCPLVCGAVVPLPPMAAAPIAPPTPASFQMMDTAGEGISLRPDYPPPR